MCVVRQMFAAQVRSAVCWLFGCGLVGLLVVLIVSLFLSFLAMPGLCCFLHVTHILVQWSEDVIKRTPSSEGLGFDSACPPGFRTQLHVTALLSTGGGPVSCRKLSEGGFQVVYPLGLWSRLSGVVKVLYGYG